MKITVRELVQILDQNEPKIHLDIDIFHLCIDSRAVYDGAHTLFFALQGARQNGSQYIHEVVKKGVTHIVIKKDSIDLSAYKNVIFFEVENIIESLQKIVVEKRAEFHLPIIGITGSNGKTIVKEWLSQLLTPSYDFNKES